MVGHTIAHRLAYAVLRGPVRGEQDVDHLCRNRRCVNPSHLEPVSRRDNILRGVSPAAHNGAKTHCIRGHPLSGTNLTEVRRQNGRTDRRCKTCHALRAWERQRGLR